jgi:glycosyltransferase involved in cell wall biosynthesis
MKKKLVIIANFVTLPNENGNSRFTYIADVIDKAKFDVEIITSDFFHTEKSKRKIEQEDFKKLDYKITLIDEPEYRKNISLKRFYSHYKFAKNVEKYLEKEEKPDVIYCAVPSLDVAEVAAKFAKKNNIRFIIDVQDLWPEAFKMVLNIPIISNIIFYPMKKKADKIYELADDIVAVSDTYLERAVGVNTKYEKKLSAYLGTDLEYFDKCKKENETELLYDNVRIAYIGTLGHSYNIKCVIDAIKILKDNGINNILFIVMGEGPLKQEFEKYAKEKEVNCEFTGRLNYEKMCGYLSACDIAINPITKGAAQSIINKVGDYAAAGLPVISTQECDEYKKLVEDYKIGYNVECDDIQDLANKIKILYNNKNLRKELGNNNRKLAVEKFDRKKTYQKIKKLIENSVE